MQKKSKINRIQLIWCDIISWMQIDDQILPAERPVETI